MLGPNWQDEAREEGWLEPKEARELILASKEALDVLAEVYGYVGYSTTDNLAAVLDDVGGLNREDRRKYGFER